MKTGYLVLVVFLLSSLFAPQPPESRENQLGITTGNEITNGATNPQLELFGQLGGRINSVAISGNYAFINMGNRLAVMNVTDKTDPYPVVQTDNFTGFAEDIVISGNYAYIAAGTAGMYIFDISTPLSPSLVSFYPSPDSLWDATKLSLYSSDAKLYALVAAENYGMRVIEVTNPYSPVERGFYKVTGTAYDVTCAGTYAYVAYSGQGMQILDMTAPTSPTWVGTYSASSYYPTSVIVDGIYAYIAGFNSSMDWSVRVVNISTPASPTESGKTSDSDIEIFDLEKSGSTIYLAQYGLTDGAYMSTVNVASPTNPYYSTAYWLRGGEATRIALGLP